MNPHIKLFAFDPDMLGTQTIFEAIPLSSFVSLKIVLADVTYTEFSKKVQNMPGLIGLRGV